MPRTLQRLVPALLLLSVVAVPPVDAAAVRKGRPIATAPKPPVPDAAIIPLPLNPIVPVGQRLCTARTPSGLGYAMLRPATTERPAKTDLVLINYVGYLAASGAVFDQGMRSALSVDGVIPGFSEALQMMARTGIARFCIPAALGYGAQATGPIPANADLVFQIELLDFRPNPQADGQAGSQAPIPSGGTEPARQP